jgi:hypothetical protein
MQLWKNGKERRRHARDSQDHERSSGASSLLTPSPTSYETTAPLAAAGMLVATAELDRLSRLARDKEEHRTQQDENE